MRTQSIELLASYTLAGRHHTIELVAARGGRRLVLDRAAGEPPRLVAELEPGEGRRQALAVLHGDGGYLERARAGEPRLCRRLDDERRPLPQAA